MLSSRSLAAWMQAELQWNPCVPDEEDTRPPHFQTHSQKNWRYERDYWKWRCPLISGRDWKCWICMACAWRGGVSIPIKLRKLLRIRRPILDGAEHERRNEPKIQQFQYRKQLWWERGSTQHWRDGETSTSKEGCGRNNKDARGGP